MALLIIILILASAQVKQKKAPIISNPTGKYESVRKVSLRKCLKDTMINPDV